MTELRQRSPRILDPGFLAFTRTLPCCVCGTIGMSQAAHLRMANDSLKKPPTGMREKPSDMFAVPLCGPRLGTFPAVIGCHAEQHTMNERSLWDRAGMDPFVIAAWNYARYRSSRPAEPAGKPAASKPRKPKASAKLHGRPRQRAKIAKRSNPWPKRKFPKRTKP
jgi:hypothetical protein